MRLTILHVGRIFVDNVDSPRSGLIWQGNSDGFIFIGDSTNKLFNRDIKEYIDNVISIQAKAQGIEWLECIGNHQSWYTAFHEIFHDKQLGSWEQNVYLICSDSFNSGAKLHNNSEFIVSKLTKDFIEHANIKNIEFVAAKIVEFWESEEKFFQQGLAFCVQHNQYVVSLCMTGYRYQDFHGIDIETIEAYRGKKLAQLAAAYFVEYCFTKGFKPYWDCTETNHPSNAVAKHIGFIKEFGYKGYEYKL